ncbi:MAG: hypothetical protein CYG61_02080 [Actinobacteria bacterium]|nr:MAG: hypothetical protein CYG61_02080 [Actinomycetota bacterium]
MSRATIELAVAIEADAAAVLQRGCDRDPRCLLDPAVRRAGWAEIEAGSLCDRCATYWHLTMAGQLLRRLALIEAIDDSLPELGTGAGKRATPVSGVTMEFVISASETRLAVAVPAEEPHRWEGARFEHFFEAVGMLVDVIHAPRWTGGGHQPTEEPPGSLRDEVAAPAVNRSPASTNGSPPSARA